MVDLTMFALFLYQVCMALINFFPCRLHPVVVFQHVMITAAHVFVCMTTRTTKRRCVRHGATIGQTRRTTNVCTGLVESFLLIVRLSTVPMNCDLTHYQEW